MKIFEIILEYLMIKETSEIHSHCRNKPYYISYLEIIKKTADLCYELKLCDNPLDISIFFEYLLWYGYLSINHKLYYCDFDIVNNMTCNGADIMRGKSICISNAEMLKRLYRELGFDSYMIGANISDDAMAENIYKLGVKQKKGENKELKVVEEKKAKSVEMLKKIQDSFIVNTTGNHAITLVKNGELFEAYDPTFASPVIIYNNLKGRWVGGHTHFPLHFGVMAIDPLVGRFDINEIKREIREQDRYYYSKMDLKDKEDIILPYIDNNKEKLDEFHKAIEDDIECVVRTLRR